MEQTICICCVMCVVTLYAVEQYHFKKVNIYTESGLMLEELVEFVSNLEWSPEICAVKCSELDNCKFARLQDSTCRLYLPTENTARNNAMIRDTDDVFANLEAEPKYRVSITTATSPPEAQSDADVYLTMIGTSGQCNEVMLDTPVNNMELGNTDHHYITCGAAIAALRTLQFRIDGDDRWDFTTVTVESPQGVETYNCNLSLTNNAIIACNIP